MDKQTLFSAIQPSGIVTIGNYLGVIKNIVDIQYKYNSILAVADLHALTVKQQPDLLNNNIYNLVAIYLASGFDYNKNIIFIQSNVHAHTVLCWILNTICHPGELSRMTQYKDKTLKNANNINVGLMDYPVLMAADILLYNANIVPLGIDQKQHLELTRNLANRFNNMFGETFSIPDILLNTNAQKIMSLKDPNKKMSKSDKDANSYISLDDTNDQIFNKIKHAVTDSDNRIVFDFVNKPGISNLISIYATINNLNIDDVEKTFCNKSYSFFKNNVAECLINFIEPIRNKKQQYIKDKKFIDEILKIGNQKAFEIANKTLDIVYKKIGLVNIIK